MARFPVEHPMKIWPKILGNGEWVMAKNIKDATVKFKIKKVS